jgi:hypothetical protein
VGARIAEKRHDALVGLAGDKAAEGFDGRPCAPIVSGHDCTKILGIETRGQIGGFDQTAHQDRQLPALGMPRRRRSRCADRWRGRFARYERFNTGLAFLANRSDKAKSLAGNRANESLALPAVVDSMAGQRDPAA